MFPENQRRWSSSMVSIWSNQCTQFTGRRLNAVLLPSDFQCVLNATKNDLVDKLRETSWVHAITQTSLGRWFASITALWDAFLNKSKVESWWFVKNETIKRLQFNAQSTRWHKQVHLVSWRRFFFLFVRRKLRRKKKQINASARFGMQRARARTTPFTSSKASTPLTYRLIEPHCFSFWYARAIIKCNNTKTTNSTIKHFRRLIRYVRNATTYSSCFFMKRSSVVSELSRSSKAWNTERVDNGKSDE